MMGTPVTGGAPSYANNSPTNALSGGDNSFDFNSGYFAVGGGDIGQENSYGAYAIAGALAVLALVLLRGQK